MASPESTDPLQFRSATGADVPAVVALVRSAYRGESSRAGWTTEADLVSDRRIDEEGVALLVVSPVARVILAERAGELVACCELRWVDSALAYFGMFAVEPTLQSGGIGGALLTEAERVARDEWNCRALEMTVIDVRDELLRWYSSRGYVATGERRAFPVDPDYPPKTDLHFSVLHRELRAG
jgi:GNAT superfamily N-acetyltransferase